MSKPHEEVQDDPNMWDEESLKPYQLAAKLGVSAGWVLDHANGKRRPLIPSFGSGRVIRFDLANVKQALVEARKEQIKDAA